MSEPNQMILYGVFLLVFGFVVFLLRRRSFRLGERIARDFTTKDTRRFLSRQEKQYTVFWCALFIAGVAFISVGLFGSHQSITSG